MPDYFDRAKDLYKWNESTFVFMGVWPLRTTYVTFVLWIIYFVNHLVLEYADFYHVFGNTELMIVNISENSLEVIILVKMMVLRFSSRLKSLVKRIINDVSVDNFGSLEEQEIYLNYNRTAKSFFRIWFFMGTFASIVYHVKPLEFRLKSVFRNESLPFVLPYRTHLFFEIKDSSMFWVVWILQSPMICIHMFHSVTIAFLFSLVLHVCGKLAVLTYRIKNLDLEKHEDPGTFRNIFCDIVTRHREILQLANDIEGVFNLVLLEELVVSTVIVGLTSYMVIANIDAEDKGVFVACLTYAMTILWLVYGYCVAGQYLLIESANLYNAYYHCKWYDASVSFKKQMIICMIGARKPIHLSGGGCYTFSLVSYTSVLKTTASYVSMLRKIA
ncbi:odorant receptor 45b-like [Venturia canescens]|uniref:odorant receptor 45b-like n=1 Tax=Venturia canescens TaxID=32260 RepID=UPI001C9C0D4E|nr:odorant receptor 45b-like [Venturia canescens]